MYFAIVNQISEEITNKSPIINATSRDIKEYLEDKNYGDEILKLYIGFICVNPVFDQFFIPRQKYTKSKKTLEYSLKEDFETFKDLEENEARSRLLMGILDSIDGILEILKIDNFDVEAYKNDLKEFFKEKQWLN